MPRKRNLRKLPAHIRACQRRIDDGTATWRDWYNLREHQGDYSLDPRAAETVEDALGHEVPKLDQWERERAQERAAKGARVLEVAAAMEALDWPDRDIREWVTWGWESKTLTITSEQFMNIVTTLAELQEPDED